MEVIDPKKFCAYMKGVRKRTLSVCAEVPPEKEQWRLGDGMSVIEIVIHIAQVEQAIWGSSLRNGKPGPFIEPSNEEKSSLKGAIQFAGKIRKEDEEYWKNLTPEHLNSDIITPTGDKIRLSRWLMLAPEHEIHHRGFIHAYRKFWGLSSHPIYGLTLKELDKLISKSQ